MSSLCFVCQLPILSHQTWGTWPDSSPDSSSSEGSLNGETGLEIVEPPQEERSGSTYHEDCLVCDSCGLRLSGSDYPRARRFGDKVYCALHYADVAGLPSGEEFLQKLRDFKRLSLGCAEARRKSSTTLQFPVPVQACPGTPCDCYPHFIKPTPGYWIECSGTNSAEEPLRSPVPGEDKPPGSNITITVTSQLQEGADTQTTFELTSFEEETYERHFYGTEHWNYFTNDEALGPVILSLKQENVNNRDQFRVMLRTVSYCLHGLVPASCICADRYDREAVVRELGNEANLKPPLMLGQLPSTPDELMKLDQVFIKSELKVGVVYVKEGQSTEEQILDNNCESPLFEEFLSILGDRIQLKGFDKYKGGLDTVHNLTGTESVYTTWRGIEIMFHVSTMLPHEEHDPQKLQKKRHIGNDIVCVVFLEADETPFSPSCIKSHFLHTFIVVKSSPTKKRDVTLYEVSVVSRDEVGAYKPYLWHRSVFRKGPLFREWLLTKIVNGERASYSAPKFARMQDRTRSQLLEDIVANLQNHVETGQIPKPYRRGSWRPIGHMRPSSPLLDSVRDTFEGYEQLAKDFGKTFQNRHICDVVFNVGQGREKTKVYAVRAILGIRSRVFLEMLYGFTTGFGGQQDPSTKVSSPTNKSSNFLQVPNIHETVPSNKPHTGPMVFRAFSRLGNWTGWGMGSRSSSKSLLSVDPVGLKRWESECNCKDKNEKDKNSNLTGTTVALSVCADAHKVDRNKLSQREFTIIEFDSDTFQLLIDYLHSGSCPLTCETVPGLICAAEHFDLPELLQACFHHAKQHLRISVVCSMLTTLENYYWRYTSASELVNMILQFVDDRAVQLFARQDYLDLSESMFQMIVGRDISISEVHKFEVMLQWAMNKSTKNGKPDPRDLQCTMNRLTRDLKLCKIPPQDLIKVVLPTKTISNERLLETLLLQADTGMYRIQPSYFEECRKETDWNCYDQEEEEE